MKKFNCVFMSALAVCLMACQKEANTVSVRQTVHMTFGATTEPATKVEIGALSAGKYQMLWSADDQIKVIATTGAGAISDKGVFDIGSGVASNSATFSGDVVLEEGKTAADLVNFYALYPATLEATFAANESTISLSNYKNYNVLAVENGIDPSRAAMFSKADVSGNFQFQHGVVYYKLTIGIDDVASVTLKCPGGDERIYGNPTYKFEDGTTNSISSGSTANNHITLAPSSGTLTNGSTYYFPVITKQKAFGTLQLLYTSIGGAEVTIQTSKLSSTVPANGNVYDLGCPPVSFAPVINAADVAITKDATAGSIAFTIGNPVVGGELTAATPTGGKTNTISGFTLGAVGDGTVAFTCTANAESSEKKAYVTLTYTYNTTKTVTKDVVITQAAAGATESHVRVFYGDNVQLLDGVANTLYFNTAGSSASLGGDYNISNWSIGGFTSTKGWKLNSSGSVSFTTSSTLNTTVQFYFIRRKSSDADAKIQLKPDGDDATEFATPYDAPGDSGVINLAKNKTYTIKQSTKEQALLLVIVNETE